ncbi:type III-A CRISPR-associated RAMP protein Csm3 [Anaerophaga thermohalophila]|uniref:type III-A CRISPR-associated RAMP protein Csm3 n=1 Tax=Anaerophaga thermohalophila TaxID=177400 RepID=UPI000237C8E9|nr:type III-A CRISPR-associated RAMP protein Csm3 [Anaerophaga thermohalophila]
MKLTGKIIISGNIELITGLHIGGSSSISDIGGIDNNVIKSVPLKTDFEGIPYIPGSSLKGKLRTLLAKEYGFISIDDDREPVSTIFGSTKTNEISRIIVSDATLDTEAFKKIFNQSEMEFPWTESKWENRIDRKNSSANPRQMERVPAGAVFHFNMIYDVYDDNKEDVHMHEIARTFHLLEDDYLGGSGTRGYGRIRFKDISLKRRTITGYYKPKENRHEEDITSDYWINTITK